MIQKNQIDFKNAAYKLSKVPGNDIEKLSTKEIQSLKKGSSA